jgi:SsrA-binding protein
MGPKPAIRNAAEGTDAPQVVAVNRSVRRDFEVLDTIEVGIVLAGSEVKSLRAGTAQIADAHARIRNGELWLHGMHIPVWGTTGAHDRPDVERPRKLLAHRTEIQRFDARVAQERLTLVPTRLYFTKGRAKLELALVRARTKGDKRAAIAKRDADAEVRKAVGRTNKGMD